MKSPGFELSRLSLVQRAALSHVEGVVRREGVGACARVSGLLTRAACAPDRYRKAMECVRAHARVVVHFHPDRFDFKGTTVAEALLKEGVYRPCTPRRAIRCPRLFPLIADAEQKVIGTRWWASPLKLIGAEASPIRAVALL